MKSWRSRLTGWHAWGGEGPGNDGSGGSGGGPGDSPDSPDEPDDDGRGDHPSRASPGGGYHDGTPDTPTSYAPPSYGPPTGGADDYGTHPGYGPSRDYSEDIGGAPVIGVPGAYTGRFHEAARRDVLAKGGDPAAHLSDIPIGTAVADTNFIGWEPGRTRFAPWGWVQTAIPEDLTAKQVLKGIGKVGLAVMNPAGAALAVGAKVAYDWGKPHVDAALDRVATENPALKEAVEMAKAGVELPETVVNEIARTADQIADNLGDTVRGEPPEAPPGGWNPDTGPADHPDPPAKPPAVAGPTTGPSAPAPPSEPEPEPEPPKKVVVSKVGTPHGWLDELREANRRLREHRMAA